LPELPEVETIARGLAHKIVGKTIASVEVVTDYVVSPAPKRFAKTLRDERIEYVGRRGKFVVIGLSSGRMLTVHLRMTGRLVVHGDLNGMRYPYTNVGFRFTDGTQLAFSDVRKFGRMRIVGPREPWDADLGVEPLSEHFTLERFSELLNGRPTPIKVFLLDQRRIAGIGNIYACEALWEARIHPRAPAGSLSPKRRARLLEALGSVLRRAIKMGGSSIDDYVDADGVRGGFQNELSIYGRAGKECPRCGNPIARTVMTQRGTWWCRRCQRS
jgi:formamidopyrimidine-DNA glycosylase